MDLETSITCSNCANVIKVKVKEMVPGKKKRCPKCSTEIVFSKEDGRNSQQALAELNKSMKNRFR